MAEAAADDLLQQGRSVIGGLAGMAAADIAFEDQGFPGQGTIAVDCAATPCLTPGESVTSRARVQVPMPLVPAFFREVVPLEIPVSATQTAPVPRYEVR